MNKEFRLSFPGVGADLSFILFDLVRSGEGKQREQTDSESSSVSLESFLSLDFKHT